jgi:hypothetical protein
MKKVFVVWFDNLEPYPEDHDRYILKAFNTRLKAERFIKNHCGERYIPDISFENFDPSKAILWWDKGKAFEAHLQCEERHFMRTRDTSKLKIEELEIL